jgi:hypothetical protein
MRGISRGLDTELYGQTNEKDSSGPRSLCPTRRFRVNSREVGLPEKSNRPNSTWTVSAARSWKGLGKDGVLDALYLTKLAVYREDQWQRPSKHTELES